MLAGRIFVPPQPWKTPMTGQFVSEPLAGGNANETSIGVPSHEGTVVPAVVPQKRAPEACTLHVTDPKTSGMSAAADCAANRQIRTARGPANLRMPATLRARVHVVNRPLGVFGSPLRRIWLERGGNLGRRLAITPTKDQVDTPTRVARLPRGARRRGADGPSGLRARFERVAGTRAAAIAAFGLLLAVSL